MRIGGAHANTGVELREAAFGALAGVGFAFGDTFVVGLLFVGFLGFQFFLALFQFGVLLRRRCLGTGGAGWGDWGGSRRRTGVANPRLPQDVLLWNRWRRGGVAEDLAVRAIEPYPLGADRATGASEDKRRANAAQYGDGGGGDFMIGKCMRLRRARRFD